MSERRGCLLCGQRPASQRAIPEAWVVGPLSVPAAVCNVLQLLSPTCIMSSRVIVRSFRSIARPRVPRGRNSQCDKSSLKCTHVFRVLPGRWGRSLWRVESPGYSRPCTLSVASSSSLILARSHADATRGKGCRFCASALAAVAMGCVCGQ